MQFCYSRYLWKVMVFLVVYGVPTGIWKCLKSWIVLLNFARPVKSLKRKRMPGSTWIICWKSLKVLKCALYITVCICWCNVILQLCYRSFCVISIVLENHKCGPWKLLKSRWIWLSQKTEKPVQCSALAEGLFASNWTHSMCGCVAVIGWAVTQFVRAITCKLQTAQWQNLACWCMCSLVLGRCPYIFVRRNKQ